MTELELDDRCLEAFPAWLSRLGDDARVLCSVVEADESGGEAGRVVAGALNYLFKSLDLIPDGIEDLGLVDDAFVFRVAAALAVNDGLSNDDVQGLAGDAALIREFLEDDYPRLESYVKTLTTAAARGRSVDAILGDAAARAEFVREVKSWAESFQAPTFNRDPKTLVKLRAFLGAKLPSAS